MRQKYIVSRDSDKGQLRIKEYASILKVTKNSATAVPREEIFSFLYEETYDGSEISAAIGKGENALIAALRTNNLFPIGPNAKKIAETVVVIYGPGEDSSIELFFDDYELFEDKSLPETG